LPMQRHLSYPCSWRVLSLVGKRCLNKHKHQGYAAFHKSSNPQLSVISLLFHGAAPLTWTSSWPPVYLGGRRRAFIFSLRGVRHGERRGNPTRQAGDCHADPPSPGTGSSGPARNDALDGLFCHWVRAATPKRGKAPVFKKTLSEKKALCKSLIFSQLLRDYRIKLKKLSHWGPARYDNGNAARRHSWAGLDGEYVG
jgi:hypothetical protein